MNRKVPILSAGQLAFHRGTRGFTVAAVALLASCATNPTPEGVHITVPQSKADECQAAGGCGLLTRTKVLEMLQRAHDEGAAEAAQELDSHGRKRGAT